MPMSSLTNHGEILTPLPGILDEMCSLAILNDSGEFINQGLKLVTLSPKVTESEKSGDTFTMVQFGSAELPLLALQPSTHNFLFCTFYVCDLGQTASCLFALGPLSLNRRLK